MPRMVRSSCADDASAHTASTSRTLLNKVPEVTVYSWLIKVLCTTVAETAADFLNADLGFGLTGTSIVTGILLARTPWPRPPRSTTCSPPSDERRHATVPFSSSSHSR